MKAMLLAAGLGERMRPLTNTTPKPLLTAGGRALIDYHLSACAHAGVREIVINHSWLGAQIEQHVGTGARFGVRVQYSPEVTPLETLGGIVQALPLLCPDADNSNEPFLVINADIWTDFDLSGFVNQALDSEHKLAQLVLVDNPPQHPHGDFSLHDGYAQCTADSSAARFTFAGIALYHPKFFQDCTPGKAPLAPLLRARMHAHLVGAQKYDGHWFDIGTPERLQALDSWLRASGHVETAENNGVNA